MNEIYNNLCNKEESYLESLMGSTVHNLKTVIINMFKVTPKFRYEQIDEKFILEPSKLLDQFDPDEKRKIIQRLINVSGEQPASIMWDDIKIFIIKHHELFFYVLENIYPPDVLDKIIYNTLDNDKFRLCTIYRTIKEDTPQQAQYLFKETRDELEEGQQENAQMNTFWVINENDLRSDILRKILNEEDLSPDIIQNLIDNSKFKQIYIKESDGTLSPVRESPQGPQGPQGRPFVNFPQIPAFSWQYPNQFQGQAPIKINFLNPEKPKYTQFEMDQANYQAARAREELADITKKEREIQEKLDKLAQKEEAEHDKLLAQQAQQARLKTQGLQGPRGAQGPQGPQGQYVVESRPVPHPNQLQQQPQQQQQQPQQQKLRRPNPPPRQGQGQGQDQYQDQYQDQNRYQGQGYTQTNMKTMNFQRQPQQPQQQQPLEQPLEHRWAQIHAEQARRQGQGQGQGQGRFGRKRSKKYRKYKVGKKSRKTKN